MTNEYGVKLDSNGYAPSVIEPFDTGECFLCHGSGDLVRHEVYHGSNREKSKALGCWVYLCPRCHKKLHSEDPAPDWLLKRVGQLKTMAYYDWDVHEFRQRIGRSYI